MIHLTKPLSVDVSGAAPVAPYVPGDLPHQPSSNFGDPGAAGVDAASAIPAGRVRLAAGGIDVVGAAGPEEGAVVPGAAWLGDIVSSAPVAQAVAAAAVSMPIAFKISGAPMLLPNTMVDVDRATVAGVETFTLAGARTAAGDAGALFELAFPALTVGGPNVAITMDGVPLADPVPVTSTSFAATARLRYDPVGDAVALEWVHLAGSPAISIGPEHVPADAAADASIAAGLRAALSATIVPILAAPIAAARQSFSLTVLVGGGDGGRGQDGQDGLGGTPGIKGTWTAEMGNGEISNGILVAYPSGAEGKDGGPGGAAGSAGRSTPGAAGGVAEITVGAGARAQVLAFVTGGPGGQAAVPGKIGPGGQGGAGGVGEAYIIGESAGQAEEVSAPGGKDGPPGVAPTFAGAPGGDGPDGSIILNGAPLAGARRSPVVTMRRSPPWCHSPNC